MSEDIKEILLRGENPVNVLEDLDARELAKRATSTTHTGVKTQEYSTTECITLSNKHLEICRLAVLGYGDKDISKRVKMSSESVNGIKKAPLIRKIIDGMQGLRTQSVINATDKLRDDMLEIAPKALAQISKAFETEAADVKTRLDAAFKLLDRVGMAPEKRITTRGEVEHRHVMDDETIEGIRESVELARLERKKRFEERNIQEAVLVE